MSKSIYKKRKLNKACTVTLVVLLSLTLIGGVIALIGLPLGWYESNDGETSETVVRDDNAFVIGTYSHSKLKDENLFYVNRLYINVFENNEIIDSFSFRGDEFLTASDLGLEGDYTFTQIDGRYSYGDIGFVDLSSYVNSLTRGLGLEYWTNLYDGNYFEIYTQCSAGPVTSTPVILDEAGIYLINIPTEDGADVEVQHADIYVRTVEVYE